MARLKNQLDKQYQLNANDGILSVTQHKGERVNYYDPFSLTAEDIASMIFLAFRPEAAYDEDGNYLSGIVLLDNPRWIKSYQDARKVTWDVKVPVSDDGTNSYLQYLESLDYIGKTWTIWGKAQEDNAGYRWKMSNEFGVK